MTNETEVLKECPMCKGVAVTTWGNEGEKISCGKPIYECPMRKVKLTREEWNTRTPSTNNEVVRSSIDSDSIWIQAAEALHEISNAGDSGIKLHDLHLKYSHSPAFISWFGAFFASMVDERDDKFYFKQALSNAGTSSDTMLEDIRMLIDDAITNLHYVVVPYEANHSILGDVLWNLLSDTKQLLRDARNKITANQQ